MSSSSLLPGSLGILYSNFLYDAYLPEIHAMSNIRMLDEVRIPSIVLAIIRKNGSDLVYNYVLAPGAVGWTFAHRVDDD